MRSRLASLVLAFACAMLAGVAFAAEVSAPFVVATPGATITVPIRVTGAVDLTSFQFDLQYDPTIVRADAAGATAGPMLTPDWFFTSPGTVDLANGRILGVSASGSEVDGDGTIALIRVTALRTGVSPLVLSNVFVNLEDQDVTIADGQITIVIVPVPLSPWLPTIVALLIAAMAWQHRGRGRS